MKRSFLFAALFLIIVSARAEVWEPAAYPSRPPKSGVVTFETPPDKSLPGPVRDYAGANLLISDDEQHRHQNETCVFINPADPNHIIGGCNDYRGEDVSLGWFVSFDGGESWEDGIVDGLDEFGRAGDPSVVLNRQGQAWFCGIHYNREDDRGGIVVSHSADGGLNWDDPVFVIVHRDNGEIFEDKPYLAIDNTGGEFDGNLYVSWTRYGRGEIYFSRSTDGGENWSEALRLTANPGQGSVPVVGIDGELYVFWKDYSRDRMVGIKSLDGGESFGNVFVVAATDNLPGNLEPTNFRVNSIPTAAVDHSDGNEAGRIYIAWADERFGDADILLSWSDNRAESWSDPIRINDDDLENGRDQFFPWLAVDPVDGSLCVIWYDRRLDEENIFTDVYGLWWNGRDDRPPNERITSQSWDPRIGFDGQFIGDYNGVAAYGGVAHPAWCDTRLENQDIFWTRFTAGPRYQPGAGNRNHTFTIQELLIDGEAPEPGDEIAVLDSDGTIVGAHRIEGEPPYELRATGNWVERWGHGYLTWQIWDQSQRRDRAAAWLPLEGDQTLTDDGETVLNLLAPPAEQLISFDVNDRWYLISTHLFPVTIDPWEIFLPIRDAIRLVKEEQGRFMFYPADFTNLPPFNPRQAYLVGLNEAVDLTIQGFPLAAQAPIPLHNNWNFASYLPDYELDPWVGFESIIDNLILAKNSEGQFLAPQFEFNNIPALRPTEGYQLRLQEAAVLVYPPPEQHRLAARDDQQHPVHFNPPRPSSSNMSLLILGPAKDVHSQVYQGEIGVFNQRGEILGASVVADQFPIGLTVWGGSENSGLETGSKLTLRYWNRAHDREFELGIELVSGTMNYQQDGFTVGQILDLELSHSLSLPGVSVTITPNPFNPTGMVTVDLATESKTKISLFDLRGRHLTTFFEGNLRAGVHHFSLNKEFPASGLYIIQLKTEHQLLTERVIVLK